MDETTRHNICMGLKAAGVLLLLVIAIQIQMIMVEHRACVKDIKNINHIMSNAAADIKPLADMAKLAVAGGSSQ